MLFVLKIQRAKHIFKLNGFSDIREEENTPQRGNAVGSTTYSIHRSLLQALSANLLRNAEAPWHLKGSGQAAELGSRHHPCIYIDNTSLNTISFPFSCLPFKTSH